MSRNIVAIAFVLITAAGCGGGARTDGGGSTPLTVADALRTRPTGIIEIRGAIVVHPDGSARVCEGLAGSFPPQCGGQSIAVAGLDPRVLEHPDSAQGVSWGMATLRGRLDGDVFRVA